MKYYKVKLGNTNEYLIQTNDCKIWLKTDDEDDERIFSTYDYMEAYGVALNISLTKGIPLSSIIIVIGDSDDEILDCPVCKNEFLGKDSHQASYDLSKKICPSCRIDGN